MSRIEDLPAEERAVLQLALRSDRPFDELAGVLDLDEAEMRRHAHAALAALGPDETAGLEPGQRDEIADWLLGQQSAEQRAGTERLLAGSAPGRAWARVVADQLRGLGAQRLPDIPDGERGAGGDGNGAAASAPPPMDGASGSGSAAAPAETTASPVGAGVTAPSAAAAAEAAAGAPGPDGTAAPAATRDGGSGPRLDAPRSSRLGGALLLGGLAIVALAAVLYFAVLRGDGDGGGGSGSSATTPAASTTAARPQGQVEAQANLVPPGNRKSLKALGVVLVQRAQGQDQIVAAVQGLPKPKNGGYGIWLYSGPGKAQWLGFFASQDQQGRLLARGQLKASIADYREILVTREAKGNPSRPGPIFLRGPVQLAGSGNGTG
jgi:hypothetical protein